MSETPSLARGDIVAGKYLVEQQLGEGGMGSVFLVQHQLTGRRVALKSVHTDDAVMRARLQREARALGRLSHPNVVGVIDAGEHEGSVFVVMDYVEGKNLRSYTGDHELSIAEAIDLILPAMCGVAAAHQAGILHRDLKPENLFVCTDSDGLAFDTRVLDFGVAKSVDENDTSLTSRGSIVGTPKYMAPEQITQGDSLDVRMDVYALALIVYELVAGRLPYKNAKLKMLVVEILAGRLDDPRKYRPGLPAALCEAIMRALATERDDRYLDVASFARALEPFAGKRRFEAPRQVHTPELAKDDLPLGATVTLETPAAAAVAPGQAKTRPRSKPAALDPAATVRHSPRPAAARTPAQPTLDPVVRHSESPPPSSRRSLVMLSALVLLMLAVGLGWGAVLRGRRAEQVREAAASAIAPNVVVPLVPEPNVPAEPSPPVVAGRLEAAPVREPAAAKLVHTHASKHMTAAGSVGAVPPPSAAPATTTTKREVKVRGGTLRSEDF